MEYSSTSYLPSHLASLTELLDSVFSLKTTNKTALIIWKYFAPIHQKKTIMKLALTDTNQVIGVYMNVPYVVDDGNKKYHSLLCTDMATHPAYRGQGIIKRLSHEVYQKVTKENWDFTIGFSNDMGIKVDKYMNGYGYRIVGKMQSYYKFPLHKRKTIYSLRETKTFSPKILSGIKTYFYHIDISQQMLEWKYLNRPENEYTIFSIFEKSNCIGYAVLLMRPKRLDVIEIIAPTDTTETMKQIFIAIENLALDKKIQLVSYYVLTNSFWRSVFSRLSYLKRFLAGNSYYLTLKEHATHDQKRFSPENWFIMSGDIL